MSEDWSAVAAEVAAAIAEVGFAATLKRPDTGPATPWDAATVIPGAEIPVTILSDTYDLRHIDGTLIRAQDRRIMMASTVVPTENDRLIIAGVTHQIVRVTTLEPGGIALLFEVQARK